MHKKFYASGFLYHPKTEQILLQQHRSSSSVWSLFGGKNNNAEEPIEAFRKATSKELKIKIKTLAIHPVYDYLSKKLNSRCYVFYAQVNSIDKKIRVRKGYKMEWFTFKQTYKLPVEEQTRQDIMVAKRVIDLATRDKAGLPVGKADDILGVDKTKIIV